jgi:hypothetical protein
MDTARWPYATIQLSCSLRLRPRGPSVGPKRDELGPRKKDFERIENDLKHLVARSDEFGLSKLYDPDRQLKEPGHTLLPSLSRHRVIDVLPDYFNETHAKEEFPRVLDWQERTPEDPTWNAFLRVQVARDRNTTDDRATDTNDWLVTAKQHCGLGDSGDGGGSAKINMVRCQVCDRQHYLGELRRFYAFLFTQRRQATFASNVTDRAYNVWLPPTLLIHVAIPEPAAASKPISLAADAHPHGVVHPSSRAQRKGVPGRSARASGANRRYRGSSDHFVTPWEHLARAQICGDTLPVHRRK